MITSIHKLNESAKNNRLLPFIESGGFLFKDVFKKVVIAKQFQKLEKICKK